MPAKPALAAAAFVMLIAGLSLSQPGSKAVMANYAAAKWVHEPNDPPGSEA